MLRIFTAAVAAALVVTLGGCKSDDNRRADMDRNYRDTTYTGYRDTTYRDAYQDDDVYFQDNYWGREPLEKTR